MKNSVTVEGKGLSKSFDRRTIFSGIAFSVRSGETLLITGRNGSGKSTLVKIISGVLTPTAGGVTFRGEQATEKNDGHTLVGLVSPYLQVFEEFSAIENLALALRLRGQRRDPASARALLSRVGLDSRKSDDVRTYSSGMKQRLKYAFALLHRPPILILDEPTANLDQEGVALVREIMQEQRETGVLIVATNDPGEVETFDHQIDLHAAH